MKECISPRDLLYGLFSKNIISSLKQLNFKQKQNKDATYAGCVAVPKISDHWL